MKIGELAKKAGISCDTIRYYEKIGVLPYVARSANGIRHYDERNLQWLQSILKLKSAGISLDAILTYVKLALEGDATIEERKHILTEQRALLTEKIKVLNESLAIIDEKIEQYYEHVLPTTQDIINKFQQK